MPGQDFGGGDGLDSLAQAHFVTDQRSPRPHREQGAFGLVRIQERLEQIFQRRAVLFGGKRIKPLPAPLGVTQGGDEIQGIVISAQFMPVFCRQGEKSGQIAESLRRKPPIAGIEQLPDLLPVPAGDNRRRARKQTLRAPS